MGKAKPKKFADYWRENNSRIASPQSFENFSHHFNLQPDLRNRRLNDIDTKVKARGILRNADVCSVKSIFCDDDFSKLLNNFPNIVKAPCANQTVKHFVMHRTDTFGPPVFAKPRRLAPVPKKGSDDWRPVGDYRTLNSQTKRDRYPIPSVLDFNSELQGTQIFSHVDSVKDFHQIPIAPDDDHKTAICTPLGFFESTRMQFGLCNASSTS
ncbi:transposon Tf2-9 polyprotein [Nephila pilipes]|uniref:Transposon Tf2-9 polyprotein n=1 Tax=Nephila pilipes TaxID=299642 RepID=A0A8X6QR32_NEPPI|nr:transposon Tf2-9 polyprotein [Nephila pilipes]